MVVTSQFTHFEIRQVTSCLFDVKILIKDKLKFFVTNLTGNGVQVASMSTDEMIDLLSKHPIGWFYHK